MKNNAVIMWLLGLAVLATLSLELFMSDQTVTKTETALFGVLQFVFSIGFAWILSRQNSKVEFERQQQKFAVAAFRRIREIESHTKHLIERLSSALGDESKNHLHELDIARTLALSISETTQSSKLDWADIIGEQIEALEEIESLQEKHLAISSSYAQLESESSSAKNAARLEQLDNQVEKLKRGLSKELKLLVSDKDKSVRHKLQAELSEKGFIELKGFSDTNMDCDREIKSLLVGEELNVSIGDMNRRFGAFIASDSEGRNVGSFLNRLGCPYGEYTHQLCHVLGASSFSVTVMTIGEANEKTGRQYFSASAEKVPRKTSGK